MIKGFRFQGLNCVKFCRIIGNLDIKLDFVPPSLINFISRQLIGSGFRLYQKVVYSFQISFSLRYLGGFTLLMNLLSLYLQRLVRRLVSAYLPFSACSCIHYILIILYYINFSNCYILGCGFDDEQ